MGPQVLGAAPQPRSGLTHLGGGWRGCAVAPLTPHPPGPGLHGPVHVTWPHAAFRLISRAQLMATAFPAAPGQNTDGPELARAPRRRTCPPPGPLQIRSLLNGKWERHGNFHTVLNIFILTFLQALVPVKYSHARAAAGAGGAGMAAWGRHGLVPEHGRMCGGRRLRASAPRKMIFLPLHPQPPSDWRARNVLCAPRPAPGRVSPGGAHAITPHVTPRTGWSFWRRLAGC